jgi:hypothetical protein
MTSSIFEDWLHQINQKFHSEKRNIILFVDNCPTRPSVTMKELRAVKVALLPPNTTTKLQCLDQGVIKNLKHHYRKRTVRKISDRIDDGKIFYITLMDCVMELDKAWHEVSSGTISNCFKKAGICEDERVRDDWEDNYNISLSDLEWYKFKGRVNFEVTFSDYVDVDCDVIAAEYPTDAEIIQTLKRGADIDCEMLEDDIGEDDCSEKLPSVGVRDTVIALETVKSYILAQKKVSDDIFYCIRGLENCCSSHKRNSMKQVKITDFLK